MLGQRPICGDLADVRAGWLAHLGKARAGARLDRPQLRQSEESNVSFREQLTLSATCLSDRNQSAALIRLLGVVNAQDSKVAT